MSYGAKLTTCVPALNHHETRQFAWSEIQERKNMLVGKGVVPGHNCNPFSKRPTSYPPERSGTSKLPRSRFPTVSRRPIVAWGS